MKMKKALALCLALIMALSMVACGQKEEPAPAPAPAPEASQEQAPEAPTETSWPERGISLVVPFKAGGDTDFYARLYAKYLEGELGQTVTVVNTEGAGGTVGAQSVADAEADGYTILFYHTGNLYANKMMGVSELDQNSFEVACIGVVDDTNTLCVRSNLGFETAEEFIDAAKADPLNYSCAVTISGFSNYTRCLLEDASGMALNPVDAGGASAMIPALLGDQVDAGMNSYGVFRQYVEDGSITPLLTFGEKRSDYFPDVPTAKELGYDVSAARAYFFGLPEGTDPAIAQKLSDAVANIQNNDEYCQGIVDAYCVTPQFYAYDDAMEKMDELWTDMEPYTDALNG